MRNTLIITIIVGLSLSCSCSPISRYDDIIFISPNSTCHSNVWLFSIHTTTSTYLSHSLHHSNTHLLPSSLTLERLDWEYHVPSTTAVNIPWIVCLARDRLPASSKLHTTWFEGQNQYYHLHVVAVPSAVSTCTGRMCSRIAKLSLYSAFTLCISPAFL